MEYCDGCRIDNFERLRQWNLPRANVMDALSQTFAYFMYQSPIFNGDPHPGMNDE
jgi:predicted unusual protein kinase regulating ubiquinone biosynthesis (AarF/ABC1/UbiB family)